MAPRRFNSATSARSLAIEDGEILTSSSAKMLSTMDFASRKLYPHVPRRSLVVSSLSKPGRQPRTTIRPSVESPWRRCAARFGAGRSPRSFKNDNLDIGHFPAQRHEVAQKAARFRCPERVGARSADMYSSQISCIRPTSAPEFVVCDDFDRACLGRENGRECVSIELEGQDIHVDGVDIAWQR